MKINSNEQYKTWGRSRSNRLANYNYSKDQPVHVTICTDNKEKIFNSEINAKIVIDELLKAAKDVSVVRPTLLYISYEAVIPAPYQVRGELQRESSTEILDSPVSSTGQAK